MNRIAELAEVSRFWLDTSHPFHQGAVTELQKSTGYSRVLVERALADVFGELTAEKLAAYAASHGGLEHSVKQKIVLHIAARNVFTAWLHGATASLLMGWQVWVKPSTHAPVFPHLWYESLVHIAQSLAANVRVVPWHKDLPLRVNAVIAYGSDPSIIHLRKIFADLPFAGFGHKLSLAIIFKEAKESPAVIRAAIEDITAYNLQGCLSPQIFYVEGSSQAIASQFKLKLPHNPLPGWSSFTSLDTMWKTIRRSEKHLSTIGVAGSPAHINALVEHFQNRPDIRICPLGEMQRPPLAWRNCGIDIGEFLATGQALPREQPAHSR